MCVRTRREGRRGSGLWEREEREERLAGTSLLGQSCRGKVKEREVEENG